MVSKIFSITHTRFYLNREFLIVSSNTSLEQW